MYNLDSPPVGRGAGHGLHDSECASAELVRHIAVSVDASEFQRREGVGTRIDSLQERLVVASESRTRFRCRRAGYATVL